MNSLSAAVQKQLSLLAKKERLPHAWLFSGSQPFSVAAAAEYFSALLVEGALPHPDVHCYPPEGKLRLHPIHQIHELVQELFLPPYQAKKKVFVLYEADLMLPASANALLKGLEEPPAASFLLLTTCQEERILPTIRSRCGKFCVEDVSPPSIDVAVQSLVREMCTAHLSGDWVRCRRSWDKSGEFVSTEE